MLEVMRIFTEYAVEAHAEEILFQWIIFENQANPARREVSTNFCSTFYRVPGLSAGTCTGGANATALPNGIGSFGRIAAAVVRNGHCLLLENHDKKLNEADGAGKFKRERSSESSSQFGPLSPAQIVNLMEQHDVSDKGSEMLAGATNNDVVTDCTEKYKLSC
ncbi:hypothetical protein pipiens_017031 [Culex pipiens pipiens]|uniref:Uncharacterized protein n=1 Tax=Culex pipiens pipiens TaxID=38569 RepID=A0ABD1CIH9_CULPP